ncbi:MAG TPA: hypothetical protein VHU87_02065 [Rhizomicrobium sp.]|jgi:hypothetical protein|nr:hypothetical protein [Rhizomicrobium sp.]
MKYRNSVLGGAAVLALASVMSFTPALAKSHHHMKKASTSESQADQTTAQLNEQQLSNPGAMPSSDAMSSGSSMNKPIGNNANMGSGPGMSGTNASNNGAMTGTPSETGSPSQPPTTPNMNPATQPTSASH